MGSLEQLTTQMEESFTVPHVALQVARELEDPKCDLSAIYAWARMISVSRKNPGQARFRLPWTVSSARRAGRTSLFTSRTNGSS